MQALVKVAGTASRGLMLQLSEETTDGDVHNGPAFHGGHQRDEAMSFAGVDGAKAVLQKSDKEVCLLTTYHLAINAMLVAKCGAPTPDIPVPATICARFFLVRTADSLFRLRITSAEAEVKVGLSGVMCKRVVGVTLLFEFKPGDAPTPTIDTVYFEAHAYGDEDPDENEEGKGRGVEHDLG